MDAPIVMTEEYWANTQLSLARHTGRVKAWGHEYWIVDKRGMDLFACSLEAERLGRDKAIPAGEPADLLRRDFISLYHKLGRKRFLQILKDNPAKTDVCLKKMMQDEIKVAKAVKTEKSPKQGELFNDQE